MLRHTTERCGISPPSNTPSLKLWCTTVLTWDIWQHRTNLIKKGGGNNLIVSVLQWRHKFRLILCINWRVHKAGATKFCRVAHGTRNDLLNTHPSSTIVRLMIRLCGPRAVLSSEVCLALRPSRLWRPVVLAGSLTARRRWRPLSCTRKNTAFFTSLTHWNRFSKRNVSDYSVHSSFYHHIMTGYLGGPVHRHCTI